MLQNMREKMQGIIAGAIVTLVAITFALWGVQYYLRGTHDASTIAVVNGEKITQQEMQRAYNRAERRELSLLGKDFSFDQNVEAQLKEKVIAQLIQDKILARLVAKLGLYISPAQVQASITELPVFQVNGTFSPTRLQQVLSAFFYSEQDFVSELQNTLMFAQLEAGVVGSSFVLPFEEKTAVQLMRQSRGFGYFLINEQQFAAKALVSDDEINSYYEQHKNDYVTKEKVSIDYLELNPAVVKSKIDTSEAKLEQFYKDHSAQFNASKALKPAPFARVRDKVKAAYERQMTQQMLADMNDKLTDITYTNSDSLQPAAQALGLDIKTSGIFDNSGAKTGIAANGKIVKAAFSEAVLRQGYNSNPIDIGDNDIVVLRIKQHMAESVLPLEKVRDVIIAKIKQDKMKHAAEEKAHQVADALQAGISPAAVAGKYGVKWQVFSGVTRKSSVTDKNILAAAFSSPRPEYQKNAASVVDLGDKGYAVVEVISVKDGDDKNISAKERQDVVSSLQNLQGQYEYNLLVGEETHKAKIKREKVTEDDGNC